MIDPKDPVDIPRVFFHNSNFHTLSDSLSIFHNSWGFFVKLPLSSLLPETTVPGLCGSKRTSTSGSVQGLLLCQAGHLFAGFLQVPADLKLCHRTESVLVDNPVLALLSLEV